MIIEEALYCKKYMLKYWEMMGMMSETYSQMIGGERSYLYCNCNSSLSLRSSYNKKGKNIMVLFQRGQKGDIDVQICKQQTPPQMELK